MPNVHFNDHQSDPRVDEARIPDHGQSQPRHPHGQPYPGETKPYKFHPIKSPPSRRTSPLTWIAAILCALLWTVIIMGGLTILIVYLVFRPRSPRFEVSSVTLNGAYLDMGTLLNADLMILANFTNPNGKIDVTFQYVAIDLYFRGTLVATQGVDRFSERAGESTLRSIHMVVSEVALTVDQADEWAKEIGGSDGVKLDVKGLFLTTSDFVGTFLKISYALHGHCHVAVGAPPGGVLLSSNCTTKR